jgi:hypothetical protein
VSAKELEHLPFCVILRNTIALLSAATPRCKDIGPFPRDHVARVFIGDVLVRECEGTVSQLLHNHVPHQTGRPGRILFPDRSSIGPLMRSTGIAALSTSSCWFSERRYMSASGSLEVAAV